MYLTIKMALPLLATLFTSAVLAQQPELPSGVTSYPVSDLKWIEIPKTGGIKYANVSGNLAGEGVYEAFVLFPAGKDNPFHYHTEAIPTVVMQGTFYAVINGVRTEYPAGSFYNLPGKFEHFSGCVKGMDCLLFQYQKGPFDLVPRKAP